MIETKTHRPFENDVEMNVARDCNECLAEAAWADRDDVVIAKATYAEVTTPAGRLVTSGFLCDPCISAIS